MTTPIAKKKIKATTLSREQTEAPNINVSNPVVFELWTRSGGRCALRGCNAYLLQDELTTNDVRLANIAHIVARTKTGPRGEDSLLIERRNDIDNLMLACTRCHTLIDHNATVAQYPVELLRQYKNEHEARIRYLTGLGVEHKTTVLRVMGNIRGDSISISKEEVRVAVLDGGRYPRYLGDERAIEINLQALPQNVDTAYWQAAINKVNEVVKTLVAPGIENGGVSHLSIFALARIPILIHLGNALGDKVATELYQHHRDEPIGWRWRQGEPVQFKTSLLRRGTDDSKVALLLSLSGEIDKQGLPTHIDTQYSLYEILPLDRTPDRSLLVARETLNAFRREYGATLRAIEAQHGSKNELHLFAAIPAPVAVICGQELLKDVSPQLHVYDRTENGYELALKIN